MNERLRLGIWNSKTIRFDKLMESVGKYELHQKRGLLNIWNDFIKISFWCNAEESMRYRGQ